MMCQLGLVLLQYIINSILMGRRIVIEDITLNLQLIPDDLLRALVVVGELAVIGSEAIRDGFAGCDEHASVSVLSMRNGQARDILAVQINNKPTCVPHLKIWRLVVCVVLAAVSHLISSHLISTNLVMGMGPFPKYCYLHQASNAGIVTLLEFSFLPLLLLNPQLLLKSFLLECLHELWLKSSLD